MKKDEKKDVIVDKKNLILDLIDYYKKAIVVFFIIFAFFISPYNILLELSPKGWVGANSYEKIIMSLGYGFVFNAIPIAWGALIYFPVWFLLSRKKKASDYKVELIYIILFASAFFHLMMLFMLYSGEIVSLKVLLPL